jgi:hypothetical protein
MGLPLIEKARTFVGWLKAGGDKEPGQDLLQMLEASPIRESNEYGFMLGESGLFVYVMVEHQKKLYELETRISRLPNGSKAVIRD